MSDAVKFIFKTLIKVPIFIFVAFFIFNIFSFCFIYFRLLGFSYVIMQTAVENNYIPRNEAYTLVEYLNDTASLSMVQSTGLIIGDSTCNNFSMANGKNHGAVQLSREYNGENYAIISIDGNNSLDNEKAAISYLGNNGVGALNRQQYGKSVTCGVYCVYRIIWPLDYRYTGNRDAIMNGDGSYTYEDVNGYDGAKGQTRNSYIDGYSDLDIFIKYKVPGLKYYPDLNVY